MQGALLFGDGMCRSLLTSDGMQGSLLIGDVMRRSLLTGDGKHHRTWETQQEDQTGIPGKGEMKDDIRAL